MIIKAKHLEQKSNISYLINIFSGAIFFLFLFDYLLTYLGVVVLNVAREVNPISDILLNMKQVIAIPIRIISVLLVSVFINYRLKRIVKNNDIKLFKIAVLVITSIILIVFIVHSIWIINFIKHY